jgi:hypothetical protein
MAERISNLGYMGLVKEVTKGVPLTPTDFVPLYKESLMTDINLVEDNPVYGNKFKAYQVVQGQRAHKGAFTVMAEPNTTARLFDMLLTKSSTSGAGPYTHVFGLSGTTDPNSYTVDLAVGSQVNRFFGVQASKISPSFNENEMQLEVSASALGSFLGREIASIATTVLTLEIRPDPDAGPRSQRPRADHQRRRDYHDQLHSRIGDRHYRNPQRDGRLVCRR